MHELDPDRIEPQEPEGAPPVPEAHGEAVPPPPLEDAAAQGAQRRPGQGVEESLAREAEAVLLAMAASDQARERKAAQPAPEPEADVEPAKGVESGSAPDAVIEPAPAGQPVSDADPATGPEPQPALQAGGPPGSPAAPAPAGTDDAMDLALLAELQAAADALPAAEASPAPEAFPAAEPLPAAEASPAPEVEATAEGEEAAAQGDEREHATEAEEGELADSETKSDAEVVTEAEAEIETATGQVPLAESGAAEESPPAEAPAAEQTPRPAAPVPEQPPSPRRRALNLPALTALFKRRGVPKASQPPAGGEPAGEAQISPAATAIGPRKPRTTARISPLIPILAVAAAVSVAVNLAAFSKINAYRTRLAQVEQLARDPAGVSYYRDSNTRLLQETRYRPGELTVIYGADLGDQWKLLRVLRPKGVVNRSIAGQNTLLLSLRIEQDVVALAPKQVVFLPPLRDAIHPRELLVRMRALGELVLDHGTLPILATIPPISVEADTVSGAYVGRILTANRGLRDLGKRMGWPVIDLYKPLVGDRHYLRGEYAGQGGWPNQAGFRVLTERLGAFIDSLAMADVVDPAVITAGGGDALRAEPDEEDAARQELTPHGVAEADR